MSMGFVFQEGEPDIRELLSGAREAYQQEDYKAAVDACKEVIMADPHNVEALHCLARLYATASDPEFYDGKLAVELALMADDDCPNDPEIIDTLAMGYFAQNKFEHAIRECLRCSELNPYEPFYYLQLKKFARTWKARLKIQHPGRQVPETAQASYYLGRAFFHLGELDDAAVELERVFEYGTEEPGILSYLAKTMIALDDPVRAKEVLLSLGDSLAENPKMLLELGRVCFAAGDFEKAGLRLEQARALDDDLDGLSLILGRVYLELGRWIKAVIVLKEAQDAVDKSDLFAFEKEAEILYFIGKALASAGELDDGIRHLLDAVSLKPGFSAGERDLLSLCVRKFGSSEHVREHLAKLKHAHVPLFIETTEKAGLGRPGTPAFGDYDWDGDPDLLISGSRLYENDGHGRFKDVTDNAGLSLSGGDGGVFGDYDNDGDLDLFITVNISGMRDRLLRNDGRRGFTDASEEAGFPTDLAPTSGVAFCDVNNDGHLDLYLANGGKPGGSAGGDHNDSLFFGKGDGAFENATKESGISDLPARCTSGVAMADADNDGDPDLFVTNTDLEPNGFYENNGNGVFTEGLPDLCGSGHRGRYSNSVGAVFGDVDGDGDLDLFVSNSVEPGKLFYSNRSRLCLNTGRPLYGYTDNFDHSGVLFAPGHAQPAFADVNNDGHLDLLLASSAPDRFSRLYLGNGNGTFTDVTWISNILVRGAGSAAFADVNLDGHMDVFLGGKNRSHLFCNQGNENHWIELRLEGDGCDVSAIGARVTLDYGSGSQIREVSGGRGPAVQDMMMVHFGLGSYDGKVSVSIQWPDGRSGFYTGLKADSIHKIKR